MLVTSNAFKAGFVAGGRISGTRKELDVVIQDKSHRTIGKYHGSLKDLREVFESLANLLQAMDHSNYDKDIMVDFQFQGGLNGSNSD